MSGIDSSSSIPSLWSPSSTSLCMACLGRASKLSGYKSSVRRTHANCAAKSASLIGVLSAVTAFELHKIRSGLLPMGHTGGLRPVVFMVRNRLVEIVLDYFSYLNGVASLRSSD